MPYSILRLKSLKSPRSIHAAGAHIQRSRTVANADPLGSVRALVAMDEAWSAVRQRVATAVARPRQGAVLAWELLLSASPEYFRPSGGAAGTWDAGRLESWHPRALSWLTREWGEDNLIAAYLHLDESTPHIHALAVPIDPQRRRLRSKYWFPGRDGFSAMIDRNAEAMAPLGLERGIKGSRATHTAIRTWYAQLQAPLPEMPPPEVAPPGLILSARARQSWAERESARLSALQREPLECLRTRARSAVEAEKRRREMELTAKALSHRLEAVRHRLASQQPLVELADPVPLRDIAALFELRELSARGIVVGRDQSGAEQAVDASGSVVARSGMELLMHALGADRLTALTWLAGRIGAHQVARVAVSSAIAMAREEAQRAALLALEPQAIHQRLGRALAGFDLGSMSRLLCRQRLRRHGFTLVSDGGGSMRVCERHSGLLVEAPPELAGVLVHRHRQRERR